MPSVSTFQTALEGILVTQISAAATTATVKVKEINGVTPTWLTGAHRVTFIQKSRTVTKVEVMDITSASQSGSTVTLTIATRGLPLDGTGFSGTGTAQVFTSGAKVIVTWDAQAGRQTAFKDIANSFSANQTITSTNELRFADSATAIWDDGTDLNFKSSAQATRTLSQLASLSGSNDKVKITANDTTEDYLASKITAGDGLTATETNDGSNETLDIDLDIPVLVASGGSGRTSHTAYAVLCGGTTTTAAQQSIASVGTATQVLTSNGAGALPTFQDASFAKKKASVADSSANGSNADFDVTHTISANDWSVGTIYRVFIAVVADNHSGNLVLSIGSTTIATFTAALVSTQMSMIYCDIVCRTTGGSGTAVAAASCIANGSAFGMANLAQFTIDTTASQVIKLAITGESGAGSSLIRIFNVTKM